MTDIARLVLEADSSQIRSAEGDLERLTRAGNQSEQSTQKVKSGFESIKSTLKGLAPLMAAVGAAFSVQAIVREVSEFSSSMSNLKAITRASEEDMKRMAATARELGATTSFSAKEAADGMAFLGMAGFNTQQIITAMPAALDLAAASSMDLASAADIASNVLSGFGLQAENLSDVADVLAATSSRANTDVQQLGVAMSYAAPFAKTLGLDVRDTSTAIAMLSNAGIQGSRAGTSLTAVLRQLANVTPQSEAELKKYGLTLSDVNVKQHGFLTVMERLARSGLGEDAAALFKVFGSEGGAAAAVFMDMIESGKDLREVLNNVTGEVKAMADARMDNLAGDWKALQSAISEFILTGNDLTGFEQILRVITQSATEFVRNLTNFFKSGVIEGWVAALSLQFRAFGSDFENLFNLISRLTRDGVKEWSELLKQPAKFLLDSFVNFIPNLRALLKIAQVEFEALVKSAIAVGKAIAKALNPKEWFTGESLKSFLSQEFAEIGRLREQDIKLILKQREETIRASEEIKRATVAKRQAELEASKATETAVNDQLNTYQKFTDSVAKGLGNVSEETKKLTKEQQAALKEQAQFEQSLERLMRSLSDTYDKQVRLEEVTALLTRGFNEGYLKANEFEWALNEFKKTLEETESQAKKTDDTLDRFIRTLDKGYDKARRLAEGQELLMEYFKKGELNTIEYEWALRKLEKSLEDVDKQAKKTPNAVKSSIPEIQRVFEDLSSRITTVLARGISDFVSGGLDDMKSFWDAFKRMAIEALSQILAVSLMQMMGFGPKNGAGIGQLIQGIGSMFGSKGGGLQAGLAAQHSVSGGAIGAAAPAKGFMATMGPIMGAAGMGFMGGGLLQNFLGGNQLGGGIGGGLGAGLGMALAPLLGPFAPFAALGGGLLGSLVGGLFGNNRPPNQSTAGRFGTNMGLETFTGNAATSAEFQKIAGTTTAFSDMVKSITGDIGLMQFHLEVGMRDGIRAGVQQLGELGPAMQQFSNDAKGIEAATRYFIEAVVTGSDSISEGAKELILSMEGVGEEFMRFAEIVLTLDQMMPQLRELFGEGIDLSGFSNIADAMGLDNFLAILKRIAEETGKTEKLAELHIGKMRENISGELAQLGTTVETFWEDLGKAIEAGLTEEELKLWMELVPVIDEVTAAEKALTDARIKQAEETEKLRRQGEEFMFGIRERMGLVSEEEKLRREFAAQQKKDLDEARRLYEAGAISAYEYLQVQLWLQKEQQEFNDSFIENEKKRHKETLRLQEEALVQMQAVWRKMFKDSAEQRVTNQKAVDDILTDARRKAGIDTQDKTLNTFQDALKNIQFQFDKVIAGAISEGKADPSMKGMKVGDLNYEQIVLLDEIFRKAGINLRDLIKDFEFFSGQIEGILSGAIAPELALLEHQQREQMELLKSLGATRAQIIELEKIHQLEREQLLAALGETEGTHTENLAQSLHSLQAIVQERQALEAKILALEGNKDELRRRELAGIHDTNKALQQRVWALEDEQEALRALNAQRREREALERQLLMLEGNKAELRRRELEAIHESNRELQEKIWALEDNEARRQEVVAINNANVAIKQRIWALEDEREALNRATEAARFNKEIALAIQEFEDPMMAQINRLLDEQERRLAQAKQLGADIKQVEQLHVLQMKALLENLINSSIDAQIQAVDKTTQAQVKGQQYVYANTANAARRFESQAEGLRKSVQGLEKILSSVQSAISRIRSSSEELVEMDRKEAKTFLENVVKSGILPNADDSRFEKALGTIAAPSEGLFETFVDYQRDFLSSLHLLEQLEGMTDTQLTFEQKQLEILEKQAEHARNYHGTIIGISRASLKQDEENHLDQVGELEKQRKLFLEQLNELIKIDKGVISLSDALIAMLRALKNQAAAKPDIIPEFASGGAHSGGLRIVGEQGPELEFTGPSVIGNNNVFTDFIGTQQATALEIRELRRELRETQMELVRNTNKTARKIERWDLDGMPEERELT